jgi:hypothetical protein
LAIRLETIIVAFGFAIMAGLAFAFVSISEGVNQNTDELRTEAQRQAEARSAAPDATVEASPEASPPADVVAPTVTADAPVVIGSVSMLTNTAREYVQLDVAACTPGKGSVDVRRGVITFEMHGLDGSDCRLDYGANIDDDNPEGASSASCRIPGKLGKVKLTTREDGADFSPIASYCSEI